MERTINITIPQSVVGWSIAISVDFDLTVSERTMISLPTAEGDEIPRMNLQSDIIVFSTITRCDSFF